MNALLLLNLALQAPDVALDARTRRTEGVYELSLSGRLRGAPPDGSVGLRFHRIVHRAAWDEGRIETVVLEDGPSRVAPLSRGAFSHAERFEAPGEIELRVVVDGHAEPIRRTVRVGTTADLLAATAAALQRIEEAIAELEAVVEDAMTACSEAGVEARTARDVRRRAERRLARVRSAAEKTGLGAAGGALGALASDVEGALTARLDGRPACRWMSGLSNRTFRLEEAAEYVERLRALAQREARLVRIRAVGTLLEEVTAAITAGEARRFDRLEASVRKTLEAIRAIGDDVLTGPVDDLERLLDLGAAALVCEMGAGECWSDHAEASAERMQAVESELRNP